MGTEQSRAVITAACRTPIGTARKGTLTETTAETLAGHVVTNVVKRSGLSPEVFDDLVLGEVYQGGGDIARYVAAANGLTSVPGMAVNRQCATGLSAVASAAATIMSGMGDAVIAGGTEAASMAPVGRRRTPGTSGKSANDWTDPWYSPSHPGTADAPAMDMSITVGWNAAVQYGITRQQQDEWAARSHERAIAAIDDGRFDSEIVPITVTNKSGETVEFAVDEHPRRGTNLEALSNLRVIHPEIEGFSVTAGNSSGINDAAAALTVVSDGLAKAEGLETLGVIRSWSAVGVEPTKTAIGPTIAIPRALARAGLSLNDVRLFDINEAFAAQVIACTTVLELDEERVNVSGSGISLGHPIAATGARMATTMIYELRRLGGGIGVIAMCAGGGMGAAMVIEV